MVLEELLASAERHVGISKRYMSVYHIVLKYSFGIQFAIGDLNMCLWYTSCRQLHFSLGHNTQQSRECMGTLAAWKKSLELNKDKHRTHISTPKFCQQDMPGRLFLHILKHTSRLNRGGTYLLQTVPRKFHARNLHRL
jgi:hypothetical protein